MNSCEQGNGAPHDGLCFTEFDNLRAHLYNRYDKCAELRTAQVSLALPRGFHDMDRSQDLPKKQTCLCTQQTAFLNSPSLIQTSHDYGRKVSTTRSIRNSPEKKTEN